MLKLTHTHHFPLPHLMHSTHKMVLSPVSSESDELIMDIEREHSENNWTLDNAPDVASLDDYWSHVEEDLKKDPEWFNFADD